MSQNHVAVLGDGGRYLFRVPAGWLLRPPEPDSPFWLVRPFPASEYGGRITIFSSPLPENRESIEEGLFRRLGEEAEAPDAFLSDEGGRWGVFEFRKDDLLWLLGLHRLKSVEITLACVRPLPPGPEDLERETVLEMLAGLEDYEEE